MYPVCLLLMGTALLVEWLAYCRRVGSARITRTDWVFLAAVAVHVGLLGFLAIAG